MQNFHESVSEPRTRATCSDAGVFSPKPFRLGFIRILQKTIDEFFSNLLTRTPVRDSGQPIYDAARRPFSGSPPTRVWGNIPGNPRGLRADVCTKKSLRSCKADNDSVWTPLDQWQGDQ